MTVASTKFLSSTTPTATVGGTYLQMKRSTSSFTTPTKSLFTSGDRFIPSRVNLDYPVVFENYRACDFKAKLDKKNDFKIAFHNSIFGHTPRKALYFGPYPYQSSSDYSLLTALSPIKTPMDTPRLKRKLPTQPSRVLAAPTLLDDFYINPLAWNSDNVIAIALDGVVYMGDVSGIDIKTTHLYSASDGHHVSSVEWLSNTHLAVGVSNGRVKIIDVEEAKIIRSLKNHTRRVSALSWSESKSLASGGADGNLVLSDLRNNQHIVSRVAAHSGEICHVSWSPNQKHLATGGNDDRVCIWDVTQISEASVVFAKHKAAVKAIAWSPHDHSMIATGGGTADMSIKLWNACNGKVGESVTTTSQICSMVWNPHVPELLTGHGYGRGGGSSDDCRLILWKFPSAVRVDDIKFSDSVKACRPLAMALCPSGSKVCVATTDECLRIWDMFHPLKSRSRSYAKLFGDELPLSDDFWDRMQIR